MFDRDSPPGPELARELAGFAPHRLADAALVDALVAWERLASWAAAGQAAVLAELARRRPSDQDNGLAAQQGPPSVSEFCVDEVAAALTLSRVAAGRRLHAAIELAARLPATAAALRDGRLDVRRALAVVDAVMPLGDDTCDAVEARALPRAAGQTLGQLRASLARAVLAVDPGGTEERHEQAVAERRVAVSPLPDGMAELWALLPADGAAAVRAALDAVARQGSAGDPRGMDARRADALVALISGRIAGTSGPGQAASGTTSYRPAPPAVDVHVTVPAGTLLGLDDAPGELAGYGPVPASLARRLAAGGTWRRILTDPASGALVDVGRTRYQPPAALAEHVRLRDGTCRFPGCRQPAARCDLDHTVPYPQGPTAAGNLAALCRHHHRLKHRAGWRVDSGQHAVLVWTSPTGHRYETAPEPP